MKTRLLLGTTVLFLATSVVLGLKLLRLQGSIRKYAEASAQDRPADGGVHEKVKGWTRRRSLEGSSSITTQGRIRGRDAKAGTTPTISLPGKRRPRDYARALQRFMSLRGKRISLDRIGKDDPQTLADLLDLRSRLSSPGGRELLKTLLPSIFEEIGIRLTPGQLARVEGLADVYPLTFDYPDIRTTKGAIQGVLAVDQGLKESLTSDQYQEYEKNRELFFFHVLGARTVLPIPAKSYGDAVSKVALHFAQTLGIKDSGSLDPIAQEYVNKYAGIEQEFAFRDLKSDPIADLEMKVKLIDLQLQTEGTIASAHPEGKTENSKNILYLVWKK